MGVQGFRSLNSDPYIYQEINTGESVAIGTEHTTTAWGIWTSTTAGATTAGPNNIDIQLTANGNLSLAPNGSGKINLGGVAAGVVANKNYVTINTVTGEIGSDTGPATGVTSLAGTANQIDVSAATGAVTLSIPTTFIAPGTIAATTTVTAGTDLIATAGNVLLPTTSATAGQLKINSNRFVHSYGTSNTFVGQVAANFTLNTGVAIENVGVGTSVLAGLTTGSANTAVGFQSSNAITTGVNNVAVGWDSLLTLQTGINNTAIGYSALRVATNDNNIAVGIQTLVALTSGARNIAMGAAALPAVLTGTDNIGIGYQAGANYTTSESGNIIIGRAHGTAAESNKTRIGYNSANASIQTGCFIDGIAGVSVSNTAYVTINTSTGEMGSAAIPATGVTSLTGTANQITVSAATGAVTLSIPSTFIAPGSIAATTTVTATLGNITITSGNLAITAATSATIGQITQAGLRILHTFNAVANLFVGTESGNTTAGNTGVNNSGLGYRSLLAIQGGSSNTAIGGISLTAVTSGQNNTAVGYGSAYQLVSGSHNTIIGKTAGQNYTGSETSNILIGSVVSGTLGESNKLRIGSATGTGDGNLNAAFICGIDGVNVGSVAKVVTMASDQLGTATLTAGTGISITPTANTITIATLDGGLTWTNTTVNASIVANNGYIANKAGLLTMTLPTTGTVGDVFKITNINTAVGWRIAQNASQTIRFGTSTTTVGTGGYLEALALGDSVEVICVTTNTGWQVISWVGATITLI